MRADVVIRGVEVYDGSGTKPYRATVAASGSTISAIARNGDGDGVAGAEEIDGAGLGLSSGFIDIHSHSDWVVPQADHASIVAPLIEQGVTTIVTGNCGFSPCPVNPRWESLLDMASEMIRDGDIDFSWRTHADFLDHLDSHPLAMNVAHLAGHGSIRLAVMGNRLEAARDDDVAAMAKWVSEALDAGCVGLSTGLGYPPGMFARADELVTLARLVGERGALFTSHLRAYSWVSPFFSMNPFTWRPHNLRAIDEILSVGSRAGVRTQISHLIYVGERAWRTQGEALATIERARSDGLDVAFDTFPYTAGNTTIRVIYPAWAQGNLVGHCARRGSRARLRAELGVMKRVINLHPGDIQLLWGAHPDFDEFEGLRFDEIGRHLGLDPLGAYFHVTEKSQAKARVMLFKYSGDENGEEAMCATMAHPLNTVETDTILTTRGHHNPASFGTFPRFLGHYAREKGLLRFEDGIARMTGEAALRLGFRDRGFVREGYRADLVLFDPGTIRGPADFVRPDRRPEGIKAVFLNGTRVLRDGVFDGSYAGELIRR